LNSNSRYLKRPVKINGSPKHVTFSVPGRHRGTLLHSIRVQRTRFRLLEIYQRLRCTPTLSNNFRMNNNNKNSAFGITPSIGITFLSLAGGVLVQVDNLPNTYTACHLRRGIEVLRQVELATYHSQRAVEKSIHYSEQPNRVH
jgi:hypothetical protein